MTSHGHETCRAPISTPQELEIAEKKYPGPREMVHLHVHTLFSALDGVASPSDYLGRAKEFGMQAIACTDHGSLAGIPDMYSEAKAKGIAFIPGVEGYVNEHHKYWSERQAAGEEISDIRERDPSMAEAIMQNRHIILLAKNAGGFRNLLHLTTDAWDIGFYGKPRMWLDAMSKKRDGLLVLSGCLNGPIAHELQKVSRERAGGNTSAAEEALKRACDVARRYKEAFEDDFFMELQMPGPDIKEGYDVLQLSIEIARVFGIKTALTGDTHYLHKADWHTQRALMAVGQHKTIDDPTLFMADTCEGYLKSRSEFRATYHEFGYDRFATIDEIEAACDGTIEIAERCKPFRPDLSPKLPVLDDADGRLAECVATALVARGLHHSAKRYLVDGRMVTHVEQVEIEMQRIREKGFASYFLITQDLVNESRRKGWPIGPGRGSAPGSLVCYLLGITELDPLKWGLSFNRFLSPSRGGYMLRCTME